MDIHYNIYDDDYIELIDEADDLNTFILSIKDIDDLIELLQHIKEVNE